MSWKLLAAIAAAAAVGGCAYSARRREESCAPRETDHESAVSSVPSSEDATSNEAARPEGGNSKGLQRSPWATGLAAAIIAVGVARIVRTYSVVSQTSDEPAHVACGLEFLSGGVYHYEPQHPPLARLMSAALPYLAGARTSDEKNMWREGSRILEGAGPDAGSLISNLTLARLGILPFYGIACWAVFTTARRIYGDPAALGALILFSTLPLVLAHGGLATTDMAATAGFAVAFLALMIWMENPSSANAVKLGIALGVAFLTKFSIAPFFVVALLVCVVLGRMQAGFPGHSARWRPRQFALAFAAALLVIWAGYGFTVEPFFRPDGGAHRFVPSWLGQTPLPLTQVARGMVQLLHHVSLGHPSYLLGKTRMYGSPLFFPFALGVKLPVAFLLLFTAGMLLLPYTCAGKNYDWRRWAPGVAGMAIFASCLPSTINLGARHLLPLLPLLAIAAAYPLETLFSDRRFNHVAFPAIFAALVAWQIADSASSHPDYLSYFNSFAGSHPERMLVDSDLDWGQDLGRLIEFCGHNGVRHLTLGYFGSADPVQAAKNKRAEIEILPLRPYEPAIGWVAISKTTKQMSLQRPGILGTGEEYRWLDQYRPVAQIGKSIDVYYIPPVVEGGLP